MARPVSSSRIRSCCGSGEVEAAARLLGRVPWLDGEVATVTGGSRIGFPPPTWPPHRTRSIPGSGIFRRAHLLEGSFVAAISIGYNPTFSDDRQALRVEVYLLDFDADVYGAPIQLEFVHRLRDEQRVRGRGAARSSSWTATSSRPGSCSASPSSCAPADHRRMPWRNGGGVTREIARVHPRAGRWRVSTGASASPRSPRAALLGLPGIDRVLDPDRRRADDARDRRGRARSCPRLCLRVRRGSGHLRHAPGGPTSDLNVMTRRGRVTRPGGGAERPRSERIAAAMAPTWCWSGWPAPVDTVTAAPSSSPSTTRSSDDGGATWRMHGEAATVAVVELDEVSD